MSKHVHCELIKAWADGAKIQLKTDDGNWEDIYGAPAWKPEWRYRIKPKTKIFKCRPYLYRSSIGEVLFLFAYPSMCEDDISSSPSFIKWLSDWQIYEVEDV